MKSVFMVAEKPSLAENIAKLLSHGRCSSRRGCNGVCSVHEWRDQFSGEHCSFKMTSVCGHVMVVDFLSQYNAWDKVDPVELFAAPIQKKEANPKLKMVDYLRREAKNAEVLILWLDCDKEGENICFEVINCVESVMSQPRQILRAHFSAVTDQDLRVAMNNLRQPNRNEALSVDARQELDLRIGCAFTRFQTKFFQGKYGGLNNNLVSYGPCQTPTLGFCVKRHDCIQSFRPETFWQIKVHLQSKEGVFNLSWCRDRLFDKEAATVFFNKVKSASVAEVLHVSVKQKRKSRPKALNTVELLRIASSSLGIGPHNAMAIAERLYTSGYINYPRTETTAYPKTFDLKGLLKKQTSSSIWGELANDVLQNSFTQPRGGHDAGDHPPIAPMRLATQQELSNEAFKLYQYIVQHFIATLMPDCCYESTQVTCRIGDGEQFILSGNQILEPGFTRILTWQALSENTLPATALVVGMQMPLVNEPILVEGQTSPPGYLTEAELITAMEHHGIGTDASIPTHIENIVQRSYVQLLPGRKLKPTSLGIVLVHGYQAIDPELVLPHMRRAVEEQLNYIALGTAKFDMVLRFVVAMFAAKYRYFIQHINVMDQLFEVSFSNLTDSGKPLSRCGKCHRYLKLVESRPRRLHCPHCNETHSVPQNGTIRPYKNAACPLDDFELICWSQGSKLRNMIFCPYCYSHPPFESMSKGCGCSRCTHPTCPHSMHSMGVDACLFCPAGIMVLDDSNAPKYRLSCNRCPTVLVVSDFVRHVTILPTSCSTCSAMHLNMKFDQAKLPSYGGDNFGISGDVFSGCAFCSESVCRLFTIVRQTEASNFTPSVRASHPSRRANTGRRSSKRGRVSH